MIEQATIKNIADGIVMYSVPTPGNPLKNCNIFVISADDEALIIDTGFQTQFFKDMMDDIIADARLVPSNTKVVLTHNHNDHSGLAGYLFSLGMTICMLREEKATVSRMAETHYVEPWRPVLETIGKSAKEQEQLMREMGIDKYENFPSVDLEIGEMLQVGPYRLEVIDLAGHTWHHIGLYEEKEGLLFSGDHILNGISPHVGFVKYDFDLLDVYLSNLLKIKNMDVRYILPGHREILDRGEMMLRINRLVRHHRERTDEVFRLLNQGIAHPREITRRVRGFSASGHFDKWDEATKFYAIDEIMAHLEHLVASNLAIRETDSKGASRYFPCR